jgi:DNA-binding NtrC family response regulator
VATLLESILVVDDDPNVRDMLSMILRNEGYSVETVENGKQAIKTCEKLPFDVAIIDLVLPDAKGTELLCKIKKIQPNMITIIFTGHPSVESAMKAVNEKADAYVLKPAEMLDLLELIKRLLAEKVDEKMRLLTELEHAKENTPVVKYQNPSRW